jgi:hypothetical protein
MTSWSMPACGKTQRRWSSDRSSRIVAMVLRFGLRMRTPSPQRGEGWGEGARMSGITPRRPRPSPQPMLRIGVLKYGGRRPPMPLPNGERGKEVAPPHSYLTGQPWICAGHPAFSSNLFNGIGRRHKPGGWLDELPVLRGSRGLATRDFSASIDVSLLFVTVAELFSPIAPV